jgi:O-antigen ligase
MANTPADRTDTESSLDTSLGLLAVVLAAALPLYRPWVSLATSALMILWLFGGGLNTRLKRIPGHGLTVAVLCFVALNIVSLVWTSDLPHGLQYLTKYRYFLLIPMVASSVRPAYRRFSMTAFELAAGVSVVLSICVFVGWFRIRDAHPGNPSPTMAHLDYGLLLALAALFILVRVLYAEKTIGRRMAWSGLALLVIVGLAINIGRTGHLAFVGGLLVLLIHWARGRSVKVTAIVVSVLAISTALVWFSFPTLQSRVDESHKDLVESIIGHHYDSNLGGRVAAMKVAREVFKEDPILGTGVGGNMPAFRSVLDSRYSELKPSIYWYRHFHNQYAQVATELGLAGMLALAWIFWALIREPDRRRETDAATLVLATVFLLGFLGEPFFHKQITLVTFALFAGLISAENLEKGRSP